jgi:hypothetical protein
MRRDAVKFVYRALGPLGASDRHPSGLIHSDEPNRRSTLTLPLTFINRSQAVGDAQLGGD